MVEQAGLWVGSMLQGVVKLPSKFQRQACYRATSQLADKLFLHSSFDLKDVAAAFLEQSENRWGFSSREIP